MKSFIYWKQILTILACIMHSTLGQSIITGKVKEKGSREPIMGTVIKVFDYSDSLRIVAITDEKGSFRIPVEYGPYTLIFTAIGYEPETLKLWVDSSMYIGIVYLNPKPAKLQDVIISIKPSKTLIDRKVYLITDSLRKGALKSGQLLNKLPEVSVDPVSKTVSVLGSDNILVLIDGIPRDIKAIMNMPSSQIVKIEVITEPTGKYALAGYYAIINIITRKHFKGYDVLIGSFNEGYLRTPPYVETWTVKDAYLESQVTLNKTTFYLFSDITQYIGYYLYSNRIATPFDTVNLYTTNNKPFTDISNFKYFEIGIQHELSPSFKVGLFAFADLYFSDQTLTLHEQYSQKTLSTIDSSIEHQYFMLAYLEGNPEDKWRLTVQPELSFSKEINKTHISYDSSILSYEQNYPTLIKITWDNTISTDSNKKWSVGTVLHYERTKGKVAFKTTTPFLSYFTSANIYTGYLFAINKWEFKISLSNGLYQFNRGKVRYEILPDIKVKRNLFEWLTLRIGYRLRRHIPSLASIHSGTTFSFDLLAYSGNTSLKPYYSHLIYLHALFTDAVSLKPYVKLSPNYITYKFTLEPKSNTITLIPINIDRLTTTGLKGHLSVPIGSLISLYVQGDLYHESLTYNGKTNSLFMKHIHGFLYSSLVDGKINPFLQVIYHEFYNLAINGLLKEYTSGFLAGIDFSLLNDKLGISIMYNLPITDKSKTLYSQLIIANYNNKFSIQRRFSAQEFSFNPQFPYVFIDIYYSLSRGFVQHIETPLPQPNSKEESKNK